MDPMSPPGAQTQWYLARDGQQYGPLSELELAKFIELGHLQPTDLLWREGFPDWRPAMIVFPPHKPAPQRPMAPPRPMHHAPAPQPTASRMGRDPAAATFQPQYARPAGHAPQPARPAHAGQARHPEPAHRPEPEEDADEKGGGVLKKLVLAIVCLTVLGGGGWFAYQHRANLLQSVGSWSSRLISGGASQRGLDTSPLAGFSGPPQTIDSALQTTPLWRIIKRDFPEWYAERLKETASLTAQSKDDAAIGQHMARALVVLRRQNATHALAAGFPQLKSVAATFYENLTLLRKHSTEACFAFISQGEASPVIVTLMQDPLHARHLQAQLTAVFEAIADGRSAARVYPQPRKSDYDALAADLAKRGWTQADMQLFSDERALARAGPEKVCQLVSDWFAAQLDVKDPDMQLRLLVDSLKPVIAG
jgi:hypothetical protein